MANDPDADPRWRARLNASWKPRLKVAAVAGWVLVFVFTIAGTAAGDGLDDAAVRYVGLLSEGRFAEARAEMCEGARPLAGDTALGRAVDGRAVAVIGAGTRGTGVEGIPWLTDRGHSYVEVQIGDRTENRRFRMRYERSAWRVCPASPADLLGRPSPPDQ